MKIQTSRPKVINFNKLWSSFHELTFLDNFGLDDWIFIYIFNIGTVHVSSTCCLSTVTNNVWLIVCFPLCPQGGVKKRQVGGYDSRVKSTSFICTSALHTGTKRQHFNHTARVVMLTDLTLPPTDASGFPWVIFLHNHQIWRMTSENKIV